MWPKLFLDKETRDANKIFNEERKMFEDFKKNEWPLILKLIVKGKQPAPRKTIRMLADAGYIMRAL